ncbi:MAG: hypothetical protein JXX28_08855, partial [Deltaproteobacteria bacterium]|nr:hypothetical protein [Deltaproteobacteria bacterium]
ADGDGVAACDGDCDDSRDDVSPLAPERCDGVDNDCDTRTDEGDAIDPATWYMDGDGDGYGGSRTAEACAAPTGYVGDSTDCDDTDRHTYPGAPERCDRVMNDCDAAGLPDDEADLDSDGVTACEGDCGDDPAAGGASIGPHLPERCDGVDNDCDLAVDEADAVDAQTWYADADLDGYGGTTTTRACYVPSGYVGTPGDCEDLILAIHPGVDEVCDGLDNDCDGVADNRDAVLGTAAACPARHCADVLENVDDASDGAYWVDSIGSTAPYLAYCDMSTEGGGWTLALKADGTQPTFSYDAAYWTNTSLLNPTSADLSHTQAKLEPFLSMPFSEVMAGIAYPIDTSGDLFLTTLVLPQGGSSLRSLFSGGYVATTQGRAAWKGLMAGSSLQPNCNKEGFNVYHSYSRVRVGIYANQEGDCGSPDSRLGIGGQGSTCGQLDGLSVGNAAGCSPDLGDKNLYAWGALFLRCDLDAPDDYGDGLDTNCDGVDGQDLDGDGQPSLASGGPDCDDTDPDVHLGAGCVLAASCLEEADAGASIDGLYTLEPVPGRWVRAWCDMSGGGWTLAFYKNSPHTTPIFSTPGGYAFGADFVATDALAGDPAARSASTTPWAGWLDILGTDATHLRLGAYAAGAETYLSDPIALSELNVDFGQSGYLLYDAPSDPVRSDGLTYYWCGGDASFTDAGVGQVNQPVGAPADCKGHGSVGSGWDFSRANTPNQGLTLCGGDASAWMDGSWAGDRQTFPTPGAAQAIWIR